VIEDLVDRVERDLFRSGKSEIQSVEVGRRVMEGLETLDPVAYVRFASVYLNFQDISQFVETIQGLAQTHPRSESPGRRDARGAASSTPAHPAGATPGDVESNTEDAPSTAESTPKREAGTSSTEPA
jgi:hypothetical protein